MFPSRRVVLICNSRFVRENLLFSQHSPLLLSTMAYDLFKSVYFATLLQLGTRGALCSRCGAMFASLAPRTGSDVHAPPRPSRHVRRSTLLPPLSLPPSRPMNPLPCPAPIASHDLSYLSCRLCSRSGLPWRRAHLLSARHWIPCARQWRVNAAFILQDWYVGAFFFLFSRWGGK